MSTKTTFKRIALVAVAALGFGLLSVVPSSAATPVADSFTGAAASSVTLGSAATTDTVLSYISVAAADAMTLTSTIISSPITSSATTVGLAVGSGSTNVNTTYTSGGTITAGSAGARTTAAITASFTPDKVGTYTIKLVTAGGTNNASLTWTVTAVAAGTSSATTSTSILNAGAVSTGSADATVAVNYAVSASQVALIVVTPLAATGSAISVAEALTVSVSGPGTVGIGSTNTTASVGKSYTGTAGDYKVSVWADGVAGVSTITIKSGTVTLGTETVTFYGPAASAVATLVTPVINTGSGAATGAVTAVVKDAGGNLVNGKAVFAVSGTTTVFASTTGTTDADGFVSFNLTGLAAGTSTVTVQDVAAGSTATWASAPVSVRAGSKVVKSVSLSLDKATYAPGELATLTVKLLDASGLAVADGTYSPFTTALTSTRALSAGDLTATNTLATGSTSTGTLTFKLNAPITSGDFVISALGASGLAAAQAGLAISATGAVVLSTETLDAISAAGDAAAEATDAANAATDAANAAAEAADAATAAAQDAADAVAALSAQVVEMVAALQAQNDSLRKQLIALTNLIIKIQKKVKA